MALDKDVFYPVVMKYYEKHDYEGLCEYLKEQEEELKHLAPPSNECAACHSEVGEDGMTAEYKRWLIQRNFEVAVVLFEYGRALQKWGKFEDSLKKYQEVKVLMERNDMKSIPIYDTILENIKVIEAREKE